MPPMKRKVLRGCSEAMLLTNFSDRINIPRFQYFKLFIRKKKINALLKHLKCSSLRFLFCFGNLQKGCIMTQFMSAIKIITKELSQLNCGIFFPVWQSPEERHQSLIDNGDGSFWTHFLNGLYHTLFMVISTDRTPLPCS